MATIQRIAPAALPAETTPSQPSLQVARLAGAAAVGVGAGVATSYAQGGLPMAWSQLANSGAVWAVVAFAVAAACAGPRWVATLAGGLALVGEVVGYYLVACPLRDIPTTRGEQVLWTVAAMWVGPLAGFAGWCARRGMPTARVVAVVSVAGMVAGEGVYEVTRLGYGLFGRAEIFAAAVAALLCLVISRAGWGARVVAVMAGGVAMLSTFAVYVQSVLM